MKTKRKRLSVPERRSRIVNAALRCFGKRGFSGTTSRVLADEAGVSEALLFRHFPDMRSLYAAIIEEMRRVPDQGYFPVEAASRRDDRRVLESIAKALLRRIDDRPEIFRLALFSGLEGKPVARMLQDGRGGGLLGFLSAYLAGRMAEGGLRVFDPEMAARAFLGMVTHHLLIKHILGFPMTKRSEDDLAESWASMFLEGVKR